MRNQHYLTALKKTIELLQRKPDTFLSLMKHAHWPEAVSALSDQFAAVLKDAGIEDDSLPYILVLSLCSTFGGMQFYVPKSQNLEKVVEDFLIYEAFDGTNTETLAREYNLSDKHVREIISKQRKYQKAMRDEAEKLSIVTPSAIK